MNNNSNINNNNIAIDRYNIKNNNNNNINKSTTSNNMPTRSYRRDRVRQYLPVGPILFSSNCSCPPVSAHLSLRRGQVSRIKHICDIYIYTYIYINSTPRRARGRAATSFVIERTRNKKMKRFRKKSLKKKTEKRERTRNTCHFVPLSTRTTTSTYPATISTSCLACPVPTTNLSVLHIPLSIFINITTILIYY